MLHIRNIELFFDNRPHLAHMKKSIVSRAWEFSIGHGFIVDTGSLRRILGDFLPDFLHDMDNEPGHMRLLATELGKHQKSMPK